MGDEDIPRAIDGDPSYVGIDVAANGAVSAHGAAEVEEENRSGGTGGIVEGVEGRAADREHDVQAGR